MNNIRVLFMDDEPFMMDVVGGMLEILGYEPDYASDGAKAIAMYKQALDEGRRYDIIILDLTIPGGMGGREVIKELILLDPEVKAIVSSGYSNDPLMSDYKSMGFVGVVAKPFQIKDLKDALEAVIPGSSQ